MNAQGPFDEGSSSSLTRRRLLQAGAGSVGALSLAGVLAACSNDDDSEEQQNAKPRRGGQIKIVFGDALSSDSPDPTTAFTTLGLAYSGMVFDALTKLGNDWSVSPMLASDFEPSSDFRTYTFRLRDGVEFHDGKPLTAEDVVFSFQRIFDEKVGSAGLSVFQTVLTPDGISAPDPTTVRFKLTAPDVDFALKVGHWYGKIVPAGTTDFSPAKGSFGTGPFKVVSFKGGEGFELERNPNYWQNGKPYLDGITAAVITEAATRSQAVLTGDADVADPPNFAALAQFESSSQATTLESPFGPAFVFGIDGSTPPFNDPDFRRAAKAAVDREKMVEIAARGFATASPDNVVNPNEAFWPGDVEPEPYDPELARSLLRKSGFEGQALTIWTTSGLRALGDGSTLLQEQWNAVGLNAEVKSVSFDELFGKRFLVEKIAANYWLRQHYSTIMPFMYRSDGPFNEARIKDPKLDGLITDLQRTPFDEGGQDVLREILQRYNAEAAAIWPFHMKEVWVRKNRVEGLEITPTEQIDTRNAFVAA